MNAGLTPSQPSANPLVNAWRTLSGGNAQDSQVALAIAVISTIGAIGCAAVIAYGLASRDCEGGCRVAGGFVGLLAAAGAFSVGGMLGLLFGSPRWGDVVPSPTGDNGESGAKHISAGVRPNTSLERIADWLTTMIVGLGLANLGPIGNKLSVYGTWLTQAITNDKTAQNGIPGIVISLSFVFAGFLLVYLWSLRFLPSELNRAYERLTGIVTQVAQKEAAQVAQQEVARKTEEIDKKAAEIKQNIEAFRSRPIFAMSSDRLQQIAHELTQSGVDDKTRDEVLNRYADATTWDNEPFETFGPAAIDDYALAASVQPPIMSKMHEYAVTLVAPKDAPEKNVIWLLHHSFRDVLLSSAIENGVARHQGQTRGPFWVGAVVPRPGKEALRLAFDLAQADGATLDFLNEN